MAKLSQLLLQPLILMALVQSALAAEVRVSKIYDIGKTSGTPSYIQKTSIERSSSGSFISNATIEDANGKIVMTEKAVVVDGKIASHYVEQLQSNEAWQLEVKDGKAFFKTYKLEDGKKTQVGSGKSEKIEGDLINGPLTESYIAQNWETLAKGTPLKVHFSILELEESVGFQFSKEGQVKRNGQEAMLLKLKPANFLISMLVDPILMEFSVDQKKLVYFKGRTPLKKMVSGKWKPLDAEIIYE